MIAIECAVEQLRALMVDPEKAKLDALMTQELTHGHSSGKIVLAVFDVQRARNAYRMRRS